MVACSLPQMIGVAVIGGIALIAVLQHHSLGGSAVDAGYLGLALSYALGVSSFLSDLVRIFTETEKELVAVERCCEYIDRVPTEDYAAGGAAEPDPGWPGEGVVAFNDVTMRYKEGLPLVLHNFRDALLYDVHMSNHSALSGKYIYGVIGRLTHPKMLLAHCLLVQFTKNG